MANEKEIKNSSIFDYISGIQVNATPEKVEAVQVFLSDSKTDD